MAADEKHEGWSNRETWGVNLWLSNEEPLYRRVCAEADNILAGTTDGDERLQRMAKFLEDLTEDILAAQHKSGTLAADLLTWAVAEVNFGEIAQQWLDDAIERLAHSVTQSEVRN